MSETPNTPAGRLTDRLMIAIAPFIAVGGYNRAWTKVHDILQVEMGDIPETTAAPVLRCPKMVRGSLYRCRRSKGHEGPCRMDSDA